MRTISKTFNTLEQVNRYRNYLYSKFDHVRLIRSPRFQEAGVYVWEVA